MARWALTSVLAMLAMLPMLPMLPLSSAAQTPYPSKPVTLVVPFAPGGIADLTARAVAQHMANSLGQAVVVDNRPSAGAIVATGWVAKAAPDGYTLLLMSNSNALSATLFKRLPFDVQRDFAPISTLGFFDIGIFVESQAQWATLPELLIAAKRQPGKLTVGTIAVGSTQHLAAEYFKSTAGVDLLIVPYKGTPAVQTALRAGEVDLAFEIVGPMLAQVASGDVKVLAVSSDKRNPALPKTPTVSEVSVTGYNLASWNALAAPAGTPAEVVDKLNRAARDAVASPAVQERLTKLGMRLQSSTPLQMGALLSSEVKRWGEVIRAARIEPE